MDFIRATGDPWRFRLKPVAARFGRQSGVDDPGIVAAPENTRARRGAVTGVTHMQKLRHGGIRLIPLIFM